METISANYWRNAKTLKEAAFTRQTSVGQLVLGNSNWCV